MFWVWWKIYFSGVNLWLCLQVSWVASKKALCSVCSITSSIQTADMTSKKRSLCMLIKMQGSLFPVRKHCHNLDFTNVAVTVVLVLLSGCSSSCCVTAAAITQSLRYSEELRNCETFPPFVKICSPQREEAAAAQALCWKPTCCLLGLSTMQITAKSAAIQTTLCICMKGKDSIVSWNHTIWRMEPYYTTLNWLIIL